MNFFFLSIIAFVQFSICGSQKNLLDKENIEHNQMNAVTYDQQGRLGDQFLCYLHAKWVSYFYGIPLLYKPFLYSDQLVLHYEETYLQEVNVGSHRKIHPSSHEKRSFFSIFSSFLEKNESILGVIPYFPECEWEVNDGGWFYFPVDWKNAGFKNEIKRLVCPINIVPFLDLPTDKITVAVHIRKGGGFDREDNCLAHPLKRPPDRYYIEQIKKIYEIFNESPLYVYLFTDDRNPLRLAKMYQDHLPGMDIQFDCRSEGNYHNANVLEDFFEMTRFDCLIRPDSNLSIAASKLADYKVLITPVDFVQEGDTLDTVDVKVKIEMSSDFREYKEKVSYFK